VADVGATQARSERGDFIRVAPTARKPTFAGVFAVTMATLMHEILLTRIFSVTMWYHYAFLAISIALFGMTVGALVVYGLGPYLTGSASRSR
jgi:hypothetical protein